MTAPKIAVALLNTEYIPAQSEFYSQLNAMGMDFFTFIDRPIEPGVAPAHHHVIYIEDETCADIGLARMNPTAPKASKVCTWEKALYYFSKVATRYDYIWFIEYDVFVPDLAALSTLNEKHPDADILARKAKRIRDSRFELWPDAHFVPKDLLPEPWSRGMICALRMSSRLVNSVVEFVCAHDESEVRHASIEYIFHTIAQRDGLKIESAKEFEHVTFKHAKKFALYYTEAEWAAEEIDSKHLYHPVKSYAEQERLRASYKSISWFKRRRFKCQRNRRFALSYLLHAPAFYVRFMKNLTK